MSKKVLLYLLIRNVLLWIRKFYAVLLECHRQQWQDILVAYQLHIRHNFLIFSSFLEAYSIPHFTCFSQRAHLLWDLRFAFSFLQSFIFSRQPSSLLCRLRRCKFQKQSILHEYHLFSLQILSDMFYSIFLSLF